MEVQPYALPGVKVEEFVDLEYGPSEERAILRLPVVTPAVLAAATESVTQARDGYLATIPVSQIVEVIAIAVERWQDPGYHLRVVVHELLPAITGYSTQMLQEGLPELLKPFGKDGLLALLESELRDPERLDSAAGGHRPGKLSGPRLVTHVLAGNIPAVAAESIVRALLVKSASLVKMASGDPLFPALFAQSLAEVDSKLGESIAVVWWKGGEQDLEKTAFSASDVVIAYGGDSSIQSIREAVPNGVRLIAYGHRISFGAIGREALRRSGLAALAARAAWDVGFFDQQGCVAPHAFYVERDGQATPAEFAEALAREMQRLEEKLPRGRLSAAEASSIQQSRATWELRQAAGDGVHLLLQSHASTAWTVVCEDTVPFQATGLNRVIRVVPIDDLSTLPSAVEGMRRFLQTAGLAVSRKRLGPLSRALAEVGVTRVCPIGRMQHPPAAWPHDGRPNLVDLLT